MAWWPGTYSSADAVGTNRATLVNSAGFGPGIVGPAFALNAAASSYVSAPDGPQWTFDTNDFTIELWASFTVTNGSRALVAHDTGGGNQNKWLFWLDSGGLRFHINNTVSNVNLGTSTFAPISNRWYHLAITRQGSNFTFFVNGSSVSTNYDTRPIPNANAALTLGQAENNFYFTGLLDEPAIYSRALSPSELASIYSAGSSGKCLPSATAASVPYFNDFESGAGLGWSEPRVDASARAYFTRFSGRFDSAYQTLTLTNLTPGEAYTLLFDFYPIDSWDGGTADYFYVGADGVQLMRDTFANYNGNPPSASQTFPRGPDEGRGTFGFEPGFVDAIYRSIRLTFTPSNETAVLAFAGQGLQVITDESWGIDNVRVAPASTLTGTIVHSTTLPVHGSTNALAIDSFVIAASRPLLASTANNTANYSLREAGGNGLLGDGDDVIIALTPSFTSGHSLTLSPTTATPLQPGLYRFQTTAGLQDTNSASVTAFTRDFTIAHPVLGRIENTSNASIATATPLPTTETPSASGLFTALGVGTIASTSDTDFWRFDAEAGDRLTVRVETEQGGANPQLQVQNASGSSIVNVGGSGNLAWFQNHVFATPGTYYVRIHSTTIRTPYQFRLDLARGTQTENEPNDTPAAANVLSLTISPGLYQGRVIGSLFSEDTEGDYFSLGTLNVGNPVTAFLQFPTGSVLNATNTVMRLYVAGNTNALATNTAANLNFTVTTSGLHYLRVARNTDSPIQPFNDSTTPTYSALLRAQYLANVAISDGVPPTITAATLPAQGSAVSSIIDRFTLSFSEDLVPAAVSNSANYELRAAGPDTLFDTSDDLLYALATTGYTIGLSSGYTILDGPLQPGAFRFTVRTGLVDRASNPMAASFVRTFTITNVPGYILEARNNDLLTRAGSLSPTPTTTPDGIFTAISAFGLADGPEGIVHGDFDNDGDNDLAVANYYTDIVRILLNDPATQQFTVATNIPGLDGSLYLAKGFFNADTNLDLVSANYSDGTLSVLLGNGSGGFTRHTNYTGFSSPHFIASADFNKDGHLDLAVPNYAGSAATSLSVLFGNGNGTFSGRTNYPAGSGAFQVASGDLNNDSNLDLAVANYTSGTVSLYLGNGLGGFTLRTNLPVGVNPRALAIADVTGEGLADLLVVTVGDNTLAVFPTVITNAALRAEFGTGTSDAYEIKVMDLNSDTRPDIFIPGYGSDTVSILFNNSSIFNFPSSIELSTLYTNRITWSQANGPLCSTIADLTGDSVPDIALTRFHSDALTIYQGHTINPIPESPSGSGLRSTFARGNLTSTADVDYFRFTGNAGDRAVVAIDTPGNPANSSLHVELHRYDGSTLFTYNSDNAGFGQSVPVVLPYTGTYAVRVSWNNDYQGEYRLRISTVTPPTRFETEANNTVAAANLLTPHSSPLTNSGYAASMAGFIATADPADLYQLGSLSPGASISLSTLQPPSSAFAPQLAILNAAGNVVAIANAGATGLLYNIPAGQAGSYYARITAGLGGYSASPGETALRFDGSDDSADLGPWFTNQVFTISFWVNPAASQTTWADIIDNNHSTTRSWVFQYANTGLRFIWGVADGSTNIPVDLAPGQWQHIAITRDAANVNRLYLNGSLLATAPGSTEIVYDGTQFLRLARWGGGGRNFNGHLDDLRIWSRALAPAEVAAGMTGALTGSEPGLAGYWRFNETSGATAADLSPAARTATLLNGVAWVSLAGSAAQPASLASEYILHFNITDTQGPSVVSLNLPAEAGSTSALVNQFNIAFDEELAPIVNLANRRIIPSDAAGALSYRFNDSTIQRFNGISNSYFLTDTPSSWHDARSQALAAGGDLVTINDSAENAFLTSAFASELPLWIGLSDAALEGAYTWASGQPPSFFNWNSAEPNNSGNEDFAQLLATGRWNDLPPSGPLRAIVEVPASADSDSDGLPNAVDPFPFDPLNAFELRNAGPDLVFATSDDQLYDLNTFGYTAGTNLAFYLNDGPLQPGLYRFTVSTSVRDRFGNPMAAPYTRNFTITNVPGWNLEGRFNNTVASATPLTPHSSLLTNNGLASGSFYRASTTPVGSNPYFILAGHFNADTNIDLVVANYGSDTLGVLYNLGSDLTLQRYNDSTLFALPPTIAPVAFSSMTNLPLGDGPIAMTRAELTGDTNTDLAIALYNAGQVAVVQFLGDGRFQVRSNYSVGGQPRAIVSADFNADGLPDLATANYSGNNVSILVATTNRSFTRVDYPVAANMHHLATGDVDRDGDIDLVAVSYTTGNAYLLKYDSTLQQFNVSTNLVPVGPNPRPLTLADLNSDTNLDLVTFTTGDDRLRIALGNGDGTFQTNASYAIGASDVYQILPFDLDSDGLMELVLPAYGGNRFMIATLSSNAVLTGLASYNPGGSPISAAIADFNNDTLPDIATANYSGDTLHLFLAAENLLTPHPSPLTDIADVFGRGSLWDASEVDYWKFNARAGDRLSIAIENPGNPGSSGLLVYLDRPDGPNHTSFTPDSSGWGQLRTTAPITGTYIVRVQPWHTFVGEYRLRISVVSAPTQIEGEDNNSVGAANALTYQLSPGRQKASVLGYLNAGDSAGDYFQLGNQTVGTTVTLGLRAPTFSTIVPTLTIYRSGGVFVTNSLPGDTNLVYVIPSGGDGGYYARVTSSARGILAEYILDIDMADTVPPFVTSTTLPLEGTNVFTVVDRFSLSFSEDMLATTVNAGTNYEVRSAGPDQSFNTPDDELYTVVNSPSYSIGLSASYLITDGPLQPGSYRVTVKTNLTDRPGLSLTPFIRHFSVSNVAGFTYETRNNNSAATATSLSFARTNAADGTLSAASSAPVQSNPYYIALGHLNSDTNIDAVVGNYGSSTFSVLLGGTNGTFINYSNVSGFSGAIAPVLGYFNSDSNLDLAIANYGASSVSIYFGNGAGSFAHSSNYNVGSNPHHLASGDFNNDGRTDLVSANYNADSISVLIGQPGGAFSPALSLPSGDAPIGVAVGDVNGDGKADIITANNNSDNLSLYIGNGNGTFAPALSIAGNSTPRFVAMTDFNNDGKLDLAVANGGDNSLSVLIGNGDGSFQTRVTYPSGAHNSYSLVAVDLDRDGWMDIAMSGYGNSRLSTFINRGDGTFEPPVTYVTASNPIGIQAGDFNADARPDLVLVNYNSSSITVFLGSDTEPLQPDSNDGTMFIGRARGNMFNSSDVDYFSFSASAGSRIAIASETLGAPSSSGLRYQVQRPDGGVIVEFYADLNGRGEASAIAPVSGTYYLVVLDYYDTRVEYNTRISIVSGNLDVESEDNNNVGQADPLTYVVGGGHQRAAVFAYIAGNDGAGDYYRLGNLAPGTAVSLDLARPLSSTLNPVLSIYNSGGTLVTNTPAGVTNLVFTVPSEGAWYARVSASGGTGVFATYILKLDLFDAVGPAVTGVTLPPFGTNDLSVFDRFSVTVNKDLDPIFNQLLRARLYNGNAYFLTDSAMTWNNAQATARSFGGHLVTVNDAAENDWLTANFSGTYWIGFTDEAQEGNFVWVSGQPVTYTNWNGGEPNNSGNEDYASIIGGGRWNDAGLSSSYNGIVEVSGTDSDGDGMPDLVDVYPNDSLNLFDLRASGPDGFFDTPDDAVYRITAATYSSGLTLNFTVNDGPLQPGNYRFRVTTSLRDRFGNTQPGNFDHLFTIGAIPHFTVENRTNNAAATATPLVFVQDPLGLYSAGGRGKIADNSDVDFWSFSASAGDQFMLCTEVPGNPGNTSLEYQIRYPNGATMSTFYSANNGSGQSAPFVAPSNGLYTIRVDRNNNYYGEYRIRVVVGTPPLQFEAEGNDSLAASTALSLVQSGEARSASASGFIRSGTDLDYFNLGTLTNGSSVFLNVRLPGFSGLIPVVSIYNAANQYQAEAGNGRANDGVAEVRVTQTGTYYAVVRGTDNTAGMTEQYVLDVQVVPTGSVSFPNLQAVAIGLPTGSGIQSGQPITFTFRVENVGSLATPSGNWIDRAVMSLNTTLGDADDIPLGFSPHSGALASGEGYFVTNTVTIPNGVSGNYYIIVQADAGNAINEFLLEGDNVTVSSTTFPVALAPYADLVVENLNIAGPDSNRVYTATWTTANRGTATAPPGIKERFFVRNVTSGAILLNSEVTISNALPVNGTIPQARTFTATNAGNYIVQVTPDSQDLVYEHDGVSHAQAELNTATTTFQIVQFFAVAVQGNPLAGGGLSGAGTYPSGTTITVTAIPNTNSLPFLFVNWTEGGTFQSSSTNYSFVLTRDRTLIANFTLPSFQVSAANNPSTGGTVSGQGTYFYGTTNLLLANANPGYRFTNWTQNGVVVGLSNGLVTVVQSNRAVVANYVEANTFHVVTTATSPSNVVTVAGAGAFTNGQSTTITAPLSVTNPPSLYTFKEFRLNGAFAGNAPSFIKSFSTLDPTNMNYVAHYDVTSIRPLIVAAAPQRTNSILGGFSTATNPVPAMTNLQLSLQFDRSMNTAVQPAITVSNVSGGLAPIVPAAGQWFTTSVSNDSYRTAFIALTNGMDGTNRVYISAAADLNGTTIDQTNAITMLVDVTPPAHPAITLTASNSSSATFSWNSYGAPADIGGFRLYLSTNNFTSVTGLTQVTRVSGATRSYTFNGLELNRAYNAAVVAVDVAGNSIDDVVATPFTLPSTVPPQVAVQVVATAVDAANVSWSYSSANLLGFAGFQLYYQDTPFSSVVGLTPRQTLGTGVRSAVVTGLDRTRTYHFAVVGFNNTNGFNPVVTTASWTDPYAGTITANLSIGGANERVVDILQPITVTSNATLTIQPGTTVRFAAGAGITVQNGRIFANGTALDPIVFTSLSGTWNGIRLESGAGTSLLRHVFVENGAGLTIDGCAPTVDAFTAVLNSPAGLTLTNNASLVTTDALLVNNGVGFQQFSPASLNVRRSVIKNNGTNAFVVGGSTAIATQNWWGSSAVGDIDATIQGAVNRTAFLVSEPLLTPAIGTSNNVTQVGTSNLNLRLACRTAEGMRLSEDSTFAAVFFAPFTNRSSFRLSDGGGSKTIYAQFRSITGQTSAPVAITVNYITAGPSIASFSLSEGQVITRPINVSGSASAPLGMDVIELHLDNVLQASQPGGSFSYRFDVRPVTNGIHRARLLARDLAGNFSTLERNVVITPLPPAAPVISFPAADLVVSSNSINLSGTAEPLLSLRLLRDGAVLGSTTAPANGTFAFTSVPLVEGPNQLVIEAFDILGNASSPARNVVLDSGPPAAPVLQPLVYLPNDGVLVRWSFPTNGEAPATFRVFWRNAPFTSTNQASGASSIETDLRFIARTLTPGTWYFAVVGYDSAGNASPLSGLQSIAYDPVPPAFAVSFDKASPVGVGPLEITITSSEALAANPSLTLRPSGASPVALTISNTALNTWQGRLSVGPFTPSGPMAFSVVGQDIAGNSFSGAPAGPALVIDVQPPIGSIVTAPVAPIQATNSTNVTISLALSEEVKAGSTPQLSFNPPTGAAVPITLSGSGSNWVGSLTITPAMGSGSGGFTLTAVDPLDNIGHLIASGGFLEIYNTALPTPPSRPFNLIPATLPGGFVRLTWNAVSNAEIYRVYSQPGTNGTPTNLVADNVLGTAITNLPDADGLHRYAVTAARRGAESTNAAVVTARSDRTPPPAPTNATVILLASGVQLSWQGGAGEIPAQFKVYRNGTHIRTVGNSTTNITDSPPRGLMAYTVAAVDSVGNEALSLPASIELFVGAVNNFEVVVNQGQAPALSWTSTDVAAVGFNIYRNGLKQNAAPQSATSFIDSLGIPSGGSVTYTVRAVNSTNAESAPRTVEVHDAAVSARVNLAGGTESSLITRYFDSFRLTLSNRTVGASIPVDQFEARRSISGQPVLTRTSVPASPLIIGAGNSADADIVFPSALVLDPQGLRLRAIQVADAAGTRVVYQRVFDFSAVAEPGKMIDIVANQQPLAGGLATFAVTLFNHGYADMDLLVSRNNGADAGDLAIVVRNTQGAEVGRTAFNGTPSGTFFTTDGRGFVRIPPGGAKTFNVPNVLVPEALGTNVTTFEVVATNIYYRLGSADQLVSGPLSGSTHSSLAVTPYFGTAQTDKSNYANNDPIIITGQAIDRASGLPRTNVALKIGLFTRGYRFYYDVVTDTNGSYSFTYNPPPGLSGRLNIWAAHPDVFDVLNQAEIVIYRAYLSPANADIRLSKNDKVTFALTLINPGDETLTGFTLQTAAFQVFGTNRVPISTITGTANVSSNFAIAPRATERIMFELSAALDAPDNAAVELTFRSEQGAAARFAGNMTLLPANPLLAVVDPSVGYVEVSANRGSLVSKTVTLINRGLRDLKGVTVAPPTNINWITVNLPVENDGRIHLPDMPVGSTNSMTIVFAPPTNAPLDFFTEKLVIRGTNSPAAFDVNLYALVTSSQRGSVQFHVDNLLVQPVPNANVRMKNTILQQEFVTQTDANGYVTVTNLQEGQWAWQVTAAGHSANVGVIDVIANQTVLVDTRLSKSLVTVNFVVTPVPYTDRYEITIEQTFETHVPAPVLVITPPKMDFNNIQPGFEATYIVTAKNHGLIQMTDATIRGENDPYRRASLTPLINYFPVLRAQETVEIPMRFIYLGPATNAPAGAALAKSNREKYPTLASAGYTYNRTKGLTRDVDENGNITGGVQFPPSFAEASEQVPGSGFADCVTGGLGGMGDFIGGLMAIANACAQCVDARALMAVAASSALMYSLYCSPNFSPTIISPCGPQMVGSKVIAVIGTFLGNFGSCVAQAINSGSSSSGGGSSGQQGPRTQTGYGGGGPGCFTEGTQILMADGTMKPIEQIRTNDVVRTGSDPRERATVVEVRTREVKETVRLIGTVAPATVPASFASTADSTVRPLSGVSSDRAVTTTDEHNFWVDGKGWTPSRDLKVGDYLSGSAGERIRITEIERIPKRTKVFTFVNREDHAFFANGILVQDSCGDKTPFFEPGRASVEPGRATDTPHAALRIPHSKGVLP